MSPECVYCGGEDFSQPCADSPDGIHWTGADLLAREARAAEALVAAEAAMVGAVRRIEAIELPRLGRRRLRWDIDDALLDLKTDAAKAGDAIGVYGLGEPTSPVTWPL